MASIDEAIERGVKNAFERPQEILGGRSFNQLLAEFHTGEIAPVVHGRWEEVDDVWGDVHYRCSACDYEWFLEDGTPAENGMNYCPHCGAKMDGERREA